MSWKRRFDWWGGRWNEGIGLVGLIIWKRKIKNRSGNGFKNRGFGIEVCKEVRNNKCYK